MSEHHPISDKQVARLWELVKPTPEPTLAELVVELQRLNEELKALNEQLAPPFVSDPRD